MSKMKGGKSPLINEGQKTPKNTPQTMFSAKQKADIKRPNAKTGNVPCKKGY